MDKSLFDKYGGFAKVSRVVLDLYDRVLDDEDIGAFFDNVDMSRIVDHQTKFISSLLGGPVNFSDDQIARMHSHLDISADQFDKLKEILSSTLQDHGFAPDDVEFVVQAFEQRRRLVAD